VKQFLLVFDRSKGEVLDCVAYRDRSTALRKRFEAERLHSASPDVEVVVLGADSKDALMRTHARYFKGAANLYKTLKDNSNIRAVS
jgi:hypothetical protein